MKTTLLKKLRRSTALVSLVLLLGVVLPWKAVGQTTHSWGSSSTNSGTNNNANPFGRYYGYEYRVYLYPPNTMPFSGNITQLEFLPNGTLSAGGQIDVWMKTVTDVTSLSSSTTFATYKTGATQVYTSSSSPAFTQGTYVAIPLSTPIAYNYANNEYLMILVRSVANSGSGDGGRSFYYYNPANASNNTWYAKKDSSDPGESAAPSSFSSYGTGAYLPVIRVTYTPSTNPSISLSPNSATILTGSTQTLTATVNNVSGTPTITYSSSNTNVATVSGSGTTATVTGVAPGTATITATMTYGGNTYTATCTITVEDPSYCTPGTGNYDGNGISNVSFGTNPSVNNTVGGIAYGDYSNLVGAVSAGATCQVDITYTTGYTYGTIIWVDWNHNYTFEGTEAVYAGQSGDANPTTLNATFTVPATTQAGDYRMRIIGSDMALDSYTSSLSAAANADACGSYNYSTCHDYTLRVSADPYIALNPTSATVFTGFTQTLTATYGNVTGTPTITYSTSNASVATVNGSGTTATVTAVAPGTATITASMTYQGTTYTATSAITVEAPSYCTPNPTSVDGKGITALTFGSGSNVVNNSNSNGLPSSSPYYGDYTSMVGGYDAGETATVTITYSTGNYTVYSYGTIIWVDWNKNYIFEDSEIVYTGTSAEGSNGTPQVLTATFTVPSNQTADDYRMRIAGADSYFDSYLSGSTSADHDPCFTSTYAVCHDYTLRVLSSGYTVSSASGITNGNLMFTSNGGGSYVYSPLTGVAQETDVIINTIPDAGYHLSGMPTLTVTSGSVPTLTQTDADHFTFEMPASDVTVNATFAANTHTATVASGIQNGNITLTNAGNTGTTLNSVNYNSTVTVNASPATGYVLSSLSYTPQGGSATTISGNSFLMPDADVTVSATFVEKQYIVTASASPALGGTISGTGTFNFDSGTGTGSGSYTNNTSCTLTAAADTPDYSFLNWTEGGIVVSTTASYTFSVTSDVDLVANFKAENCNIPISLTTTNITDHSATLGWSDVAGAYNIRYREAESESTIFFDNFDDNNLTTIWTVYTQGDAGAAWRTIDPSDGLNIIPQSGTYVASAWSWNSSEYNADNWLITPQITFNNSILRFWVRTNAAYPDNYEVLLSTTGNAIANFTTTLQAMAPAPDNGQWNLVTIDLSSYSGQGYIAIHHEDYNQNYLLIDDFGVYSTNYGPWITVSTSDNPFVISDLDPETAYQWEVQSDCGDDNLSGWSSTMIFFTEAQHYNIYIADGISGGTITTTPVDEAAAGTTVAINSSSSYGYYITSLTVTDEDNNPVTVSNYKFIMPSSDVTVSATYDLRVDCETEDFSTTEIEDLPSGWTYYTAQGDFDPMVDTYQNLFGNNNHYLSFYADASGDDSYAFMPKYEAISSITFRYRQSSINYCDLTIYCYDGENLTQLVQLNPGDTQAHTYQLSDAMINTINSSGGRLVFSWYASYIDNDPKYAGIDDIQICFDTDSYLWTTQVATNPGTDHFEVDGSGNVTIKSERGLAWLISYVNGFNSQTANNLSGKTVTLAADVDMSEYIFTPIGYDNTHAFSGTFNGNYHTIKGLNIAGSDEATVVETKHGAMNHTGLFGYTSGATIENTFVVGGALACKQVGGNLGGIVGNAAGSTSITFCESAAELTAIGNNSNVGGIAGTATGNVNAVMAVGDITINGTGAHAGGITGTGGTVKTFITNHTIGGSGAAGATKNTSATNGYCLTSNSGYNMGTTGFTAATSPAYGDYTSNNTVSSTPLVDVLNGETKADGFEWIRPKGVMNLNGSYPIFKRTTNDGVAVMNETTDSEGRVLRYGELNSLLDMTEYQDSHHSVFMYNNGNISTAPSGTKLYIDENVAMTQSASSVNATVGITIDNSANNGEMKRDWHMIATPLDGVDLGITYTSTATVPWGTSSSDDAAVYDAMKFNADGYFPKNMEEHKTEVDYYDFYEKEYHWINLKRNANSHFHQDGDHEQIKYDQGKTMKLGNGYLLALGDDAAANEYVYLSATGKLNNATVPVTITNQGEHLNGYNFLGNPYQSYLDFTAFADFNENAIWTEDDYGYRSFLIYDADNGFVEYLTDGVQSFSQGATATTNQFIHPHQGFFIVKNSGNPESDNEAVVKFTTSMRSIAANAATFRDAQPTYPLVNLICTDDEGKQEISVIEVERPRAAGSLKAKSLLNGKCTMYVRLNDEDFKSVFIEGTPDYVPVWFKATESGVFTMSWSTANDNFGYLHLIDNLTGNDIDMLATDSYSFQAQHTDSKARFRLAFKPLGVEEITSETENFAFINGNELVVTGEGELSMIDLNGRVLVTEHLSGQQSHITLPNVAVGMYMLRLTNNKDVKVQKIVVRK